MAKIYGLFGAMSGKVADVVMSVRNGQQIVRKYQPVVANPKSQNQYTTRARFKMISQLSAVLASVIAMPRISGVSPRNRFSSVNFPISSFDGTKATIDLDKVQLTSSVVGFPQLTATRGASAIEVSLDNEGDASAADFDRVVYAMFVRNQDDTLMFAGSTVVNEPGDGGIFSAELPYTEKSAVVYGYGMRDNSDAARMYFGNTEVTSAAMVAQLIVSHTLSDTDVTVSRTVGTLLAGTEPAVPVTLTILKRGSGDGTVVGTGTYDAGQSVTVRATADGSSQFNGWYNLPSGGSAISMSNPYTFTITEDRTLYCEFGSTE